jgi:hypothetical protein
LSRSRARRRRSRLEAALAGVFVTAAFGSSPAHAGPDLADGADESVAPAIDVRLAPSPRGALGAWLVAGPLPAGERGLAALRATDLEAARSARLGARALGGTWKLASSGDGPVDLVAALRARGKDLVALAASVVHVPRAGRYLLLLGVDDGVEVRVDGKLVHTRDEARPLRDDDDVVPLDLDAGDHDVVLALHQRDGAWALRARFLDATLALAPGAYARLAGTTAEDARALASSMSWVSFERALVPSAIPPRYAPRLVVRFPEGAPRGVPLEVRARMEGAFDVRAGAVPVTDEGVSDLVVSLPPVASAGASRTLEVQVAGRTVRASLPPRGPAEAALGRAARVLARIPDDADFMRPGSRASVDHVTRHLDGLLVRGDGDASAMDEEASELDALADALERGEDPYRARTGAMRRALRSPIDGNLSELGLYVPPSYRAERGGAEGAGAPRRYPLIVALHGMNGFPLAMIRWLFGGDDPKHDQAWEDRHVGPLPAVDAFVIAPGGRGNTMYRDVGEQDVVDAVAWARAAFPIDDARITITGPSMGGIGAGAIPLRRPETFAAAQPLCGYHSLFVRRDVAGRPIRPWERFLAEERSAAFWAENGEHLPLHVVHGTKDLPVENSGVLVDRYEQLHYAVRHEHPDVGHNVWQPTYENLAGVRWLLTHRRTPSPRHVRFRTSRTRWGTSAWVTVEELASVRAWGDVDARVMDRAKVVATTTGVSAVTFERDPALLDGGDVTLEMDGRKLTFAAGETLAVHVPDEATPRAWMKGPAVHARPIKAGRVTGPLRDLLFEPALVVFAADEPERRATEEVARALARGRPGITLAYPVVSDAEFFARGETLANARALVLVGRKNRVLAELQKLETFPIQIEDGEVVVGREHLRGREVGAAFIRPNPARRDRYVVVVAGADVPGMLRATSLPDLVPDFVVWDATMSPARGQLLLGAGAVRAAGFFEKDWSLPADVRDPLASATRPGARSEREATPYLP